MISGIALGLAALAGVWQGWPALLLVAGALCATSLIERQWHARLIILCLVFAAVGALRSPDPHPIDLPPEVIASTSAVGRVVDFPRPASDGQRILLQTEEVCIEQQCLPASARIVVYVRQEGPPLARGATVRVDWRVDPPQSLTPGYRDFVASQQAAGSAVSWSVQVESSAPWYWQAMANANQAIGARLQEHIPGDAGALANGIISGDDSALSDRAAADFLATGTTHITAVSGQNVALILGFCSAWYQPMSRRGRIAFHVSLIVVVWSYALFVGLEAPAFRAAIFSTLMIIGRHTGRRPDPVTLLSLTLGAIALLDPWVVQTVGFWLSAVASFAICFTLPVTAGDGARKLLRDLIYTTVLASCATMPMILMTFGSWSPMTLVANIALNPVMSVAFPLCYLFSIIALILPALAPIAAIPPTLVLNLALDIVNQLAPWAGTVRLDALTPLAAFILWIPIALWIWLASSESDRWLRRLVG